MAFTAYKGERKPTKTTRKIPESEPKIVIRKSGNIAFSIGAIRMMDIKQGSFCQFYFDSKTQRIGFKITQKNIAGLANKISMNLERRITSVSGMGFLHYNNVDHRVTKKYTPWYDEKLKMFIIQLQIESSNNE